MKTSLCKCWLFIKRYNASSLGVSKAKLFCHILKDFYFDANVTARVQRDYLHVTFALSCIWLTKKLSIFSVLKVWIISKFFFSERSILCISLVVVKPKVIEFYNLRHNVFINDNSWFSTFIFMRKQLFSIVPILRKESIDGSLGNTRVMVALCLFPLTAYSFLMSSYFFCYFMLSIIILISSFQPDSNMVETFFLDLMRYLSFWSEKKQKKVYFFAWT